MINRQLKDSIPHCVFYPQMGIQSAQLGIFYPIGDWGFNFWLSSPNLSPRLNWVKYPLLVGDWISLLGDTIHNWG